MNGLTSRGGLQKYGKFVFLVVAFIALFGYALKTGKCSTHEQQLKNQREAIERTARLLADLEQKIKKTNHNKEPAPQRQTKVGTKNDDVADEEES